MKITVKNKSEVGSTYSAPGVVSHFIPAGGECDFEDIVHKQKVPTAQGEQEIDVVFSAFQLAKDAVQSYGRVGLEFTYDGSKYSYGKVEKIALSDKEVAKVVEKVDPFFSASASDKKGKH